MKENTKEHTYSFFEDFDEEGIFVNRKDPVGSYGDKDAIEDLTADRVVAPITFIQALDGVIAPAPSVDVMKILDAPTRVSLAEMVCLAGPCQHYIEQVVKTGELVDGSPFKTVKRYCSRLRTWAEVMQLDDVNIIACSGHAPPATTSPVESSRINQSRARLSELNKNAMGIPGHDLGICHSGMCEHYIVVVYQALDENANWAEDKRRYCLRLAGAARPRLLISYQPVLGCSGLKSLLPDGPTRWRVLSKNQDVVDAQRRKDAERKANDGPADRGAGTGSGGSDSASCCGRAGPCDCRRAEGCAEAPDGGDVPADREAGGGTEGTV